MTCSQVALGSSPEQLAAEIAEQGRAAVAIEADLSKPEAPVEPAEVADLTLAVFQNGYIANQVFSVDGGIYPR